MHSERAAWFVHSRTLAALLVLHVLWFFFPPKTLYSTLWFFTLSRHLPLSGSRHTSRHFGSTRWFIAALRDTCSFSSSLSETLVLSGSSTPRTLATFLGFATSGHAALSGSSHSRTLAAHSGSCNAQVQLKHLQLVRLPPGQPRSLAALSSSSCSQDACSLLYFHTLKRHLHH
jgi:hypothetical protein